jgi:hypothetical protein
MTQRKLKHRDEQGFIALISAIVISVLLLNITFTLSFSGYSSRFNILNAEFKSISAALANACVDTAIVKLIEDSSYAGGETIEIDPGKFCEIISVTGSTEKTIKTQADFNSAHTNLEVVVELVGGSGSGNEYALWAGNTSCPEKSFQISGNSNYIEGSVHAQYVTIGGTDNEVTKDTEYVVNINYHPGNNPGIKPVKVDAVAPRPVTFSLADYQPGGSKAVAAGSSYFYNEGKLDFKSDQPDGLYYSTGEISINVNGITGKYTFVTPEEITVNGNSQNFSPFSENLFLFSGKTYSGSEACDKFVIKRTGNENNWLGILYSPGGLIEVSGQRNITVNGCGFGSAIKLNGNLNRFRIDPNDPSLCAPAGLDEGGGGSGGSGSVTIVSWKQKNN